MFNIVRFTHFTPNKGDFKAFFHYGKDEFYFVHFCEPVTVLYDNSIFKTSPHALLFYTPKKSNIKFLNANSPCDILQFKGNIDSFLSSVGLHTNRFYYLNETEVLFNIIEKIEVEYYNARPYYNQIISNIFEELVLKLSRDYSSETIIGSKAKKTLYTFDFENTWSTTESYPTLRNFKNENSAPSKVWSGALTKPDYDGKGDSEENPILISSAEELAWIVANNADYKFFKITNDIYLNDIEKIDWKKGNSIDPDYAPKRWFLGYEASDFSGCVDGAGHIIHGLYYNETPEESGYTESSTIGAGLFPSVKHINLSGLGIKNSYMKHYDNFCFGAFIGYAHYHGYGSIDSCFVDSTVKLVGADVGGFAGGGDLNKRKFTIKNCYSLAKIRGSKYIGAFIADSWTEGEWIIEDSYCIGKPYGASWKFPELKNVFSTEHSTGNTSYLVSDSSSHNINKDTLIKFRYLRNKMFSTINENWTIERMAKEVNFSQSRFCSIYKEIYGISPVADQIKEKINVAKNMLSYGNLPIGEISLSLGYDNATHFSRQFKSIVGYSPAAYREKFKK